MSYADRWTDRELADLEKKIFNIYSEAQKDFEKQATAYFAEFAERDEVKRKKVESGELSKNEYTQWRLAQMGRGERLNHMARKMAERATKANEVSVAYVNDTTPGIYSLNRNHEAYVIEGLGHEMVGADFSLYNEQAVRRLVVENPDIMPYYPEKRAVARGIDLEYGQNYIKRHITGGIIQGKSVYKIADDLQRDLTNMSRASAVRTARTAITAAQNGGRQATMDSARAMGINLRKRWVSAKDARVRDVHGIADGQTVPTDEPFIVGGEKMMFPGDRTSASGWNLYNCRCGMRTVEKEGIEAEPRQVRIQNPAWTDAYEAEEKAKAKYERALEKEKAETDPEKKKALRKQRLEKQHEYEALQKKRREIPKNKVVGEITYAEWAKLRGLSSGKSLTSSKSRGIIRSRNMANGSRQPRSKILSKDEISRILDDAKALGIPEEMLRFNKGSRTAFIDGVQKINIRGDILPDRNSTIARDRMSERAVLAHEYYGHYKNHPSEYDYDDWRDEYRASRDAALNAPNLTDEDRALLMIDAYDRMKEVGKFVEYDDEARRIIYGY